MMNYDIDWIGKRKLFFAFSGLLMGASFFSMVTQGFNYGIDFTGGTMLQVTYPGPKTLADLRRDLAKAGFENAQPQSFAGTNSFAVFMKGTEQQGPKLAEDIIAGLEKSDSAVKLRIDRKEFVGPTVGRHIKRQAITAIVLALLAIIGYVAVRFHNPLWGAAGVVALAHDVIFTAGIFSAFKIEVDLVIVAAFLTIAGYSINDTIVIFDRMRENMRLRRAPDLRSVINLSINEMRSRTLITNGVVFSVVIALLLLGGPVIHNFALAMVIGAIVGTYSTIAIANQLVYQWSDKRDRRAADLAASKPKPIGKK